MTAISTAGTASCSAPANLRASTCTLVTRGQVASIVRRFRVSALAWTLGATPWALNTPKGIIDLRNGRIRQHDRSALCSKITAVAPADSQ